VILFCQKIAVPPITHSNQLREEVDDWSNCAQISWRHVHRWLPSSTVSISTTLCLLALSQTVLECSEDMFE